VDVAGDINCPVT